MALKLWEDGVDNASIATIPENGNFKSVGDSFLEKADPFEYDSDKIIIADGFACDLYDGNGWRQISNREEIEFTPADNLDTGSSLEMGEDYYIYVGLKSQTPEIVVSTNSTKPQGFTEENSRKIGGFHYGRIRKCSDDGLNIPIDSAGNKFGSTGTIWQKNCINGILHNSIWDLKNRPKTLMPGLAKVGNTWVSIYPMSVEEAVTISATGPNSVSSGKLVSKYGKLPCTGIEGLNQYHFNELAQKQGMRLTRYSEFLASAFGNPQGQDGADEYGWTKTTNNSRMYTGCLVNQSDGAYFQNGLKPFAVSAMNICDTVGNVWEWQNDYTIRQDSTDWKYYDSLGREVGQAFLPFASGLSAFICGGDWVNGVHCGSRTVGLSYYPWYVSVGFGARFACDAR